MKSKKEVLKQKRLQKDPKITSEAASIKEIRESLKKAEKKLKKIKTDLGPRKKEIKTKLKTSKSNKTKKTIRTKPKTLKFREVKKTSKIEPKISKTKKTKINKAEIGKDEIKKANIKKTKNKKQKTKITEIKNEEIKKAEIDISNAEVSFKDSKVINQGSTATETESSPKLKTEVSKVIDFDVPKRSELGKIEKVSTGIANLDKITLGGFNRNSINLIMGETGTAKSILAMQFLVEGTKKGEPCLFISFEESKTEFYNNMMKLGWNLLDLEKKGKFFFLHYSPGKVKTMLEEGGGIIENLVIKQKIKRISIDSITSFALLFEDYVKKRESILLLFSLLRKWETTTILTYVGNPIEKFKVSPNILEFESDSIILLYLFREEKNRNRYLEVFKMRGTDHSKQIYQFEIKNGINLTDKVLVGNIR